MGLTAFANFYCHCHTDGDNGETYSTLTRLPLSPMIHPTEAMRYISDSVVRHCEIISLEARDYMLLIESAVKAGVRGGAVWDRLQLHSAEKAGCDRIGAVQSRGRQWS